MTDQEAAEFVRDYFVTLFETRDLSALEQYVHPDYFDDDIGDPEIDHVEAGKGYLQSLYQRHPTINVTPIRTIVQDEVISSYLEWSTTASGERTVHVRGIALFVMESGRILKRHTFIYYNDQALRPSE